MNPLPTDPALRMPSPAVRTLVTRARIALLAAVLAVAACSKSESEPPAPTNVVGVPGDGQVTLSWTSTTDATWWVFYAADASITLQNWTTLTGAKSYLSAVSPQVITGLTNGTPYTFIINGRNNGGKGGPGSTPVTVTPRYAGYVWTPLAAPFTPVALNGVTRTAVQFWAVGAGGALFTSVDGLTWVAVASNVTANLNAVVYAGGRYIAVGDGGTITSSDDGATWTARSSGTTANLRGVTMLGGLYIAVGDAGTVLTSGDATSWTSRSSGTTATLYTVASTTSVAIAAGAGGTLLSSNDSANWQALASGTTADLKGVAASSVRWVVTGNNGTIVTSDNGTTWTPLTPVTTAHLTGANFGSQFTAPGKGGTILVSQDGLSWATASSGTVSDLSTIAYGGGIYVAVGAGGTVTTSR